MKAFTNLSNVVIKLQSYKCSCYKCDEFFIQIVVNKMKL